MSTHSIIEHAAQEASDSGYTASESMSEQEQAEQARNERIRDFGGQTGVRRRGGGADTIDYPDDGVI